MNGQGWVIDETGTTPDISDLSHVFRLMGRRVDTDLRKAHGARVVIGLSPGVDRKLAVWPRPPLPGACVDTLYYALPT